MRLHYDSEPPRSIDPHHHEFSDDMLVWQLHTLPLGNGYLGASVYGYTDTERVQITENSFANPYKRPELKVIDRCRAGVTSFADLYLHFGHAEHSDYARELDLEDGICRISYISAGVRYTREYFTSYPDRVLCMKISSDTGGRVNFTAEISIPYIGDFCHVPGDGLARFGKVWTEDDDTIIAESRLDFYDVICHGRWKILTRGGSTTANDEKIKVCGADEAILVFACGTNYKMESRVFLEPDPKKKLLPYPHPKERVLGIINDACALGFNGLKSRHIADYFELYGRCQLDLGHGEDDIIPTDELVRRARNGNISPHLEALLFAYGRYLLIASSRIGCLPSNLQGVWSAYRTSPWSAGYWHNINVQMNYWPSQVTNLAECFVSYSDYGRAYMAKAKELADEYIKESYPSRYTSPGENGWIIGTGGWPYTIDGASGHSGPGTGAFTSLLFWDQYDYTRDTEYLCEVAYPMLRDMSVFFSKTLVKMDGKYLVEKSASPEQCNPDGSYHMTVGCAFDQQMVYENYKRTLEAAEILGIEEPLLDIIKEQIDYLDPILIGGSGQIKEFREEDKYGDIGEYEHRHVSHLVALYPGTSINMKTPEYMNAARVTLRERGKGTSGWSRAHRILLLARAKEGEKAHEILGELIKNNIPENLWDQHPPFQIDGNFGYTAGVAELLLQSQAGYLDILPALPKKWSDGSFKGLVARGNFVVDCEFRHGIPTRARITSRAGEELWVKHPRLVGARIAVNGKSIEWSNDCFSMKTSKGDIIKIYFKGE